MTTTATILSPALATQALLLMYAPMSPADITMRATVGGREMFITVSVPTKSEDGVIIVQPTNSDDAHVVGFTTRTPENAFKCYDHRAMMVRESKSLTDLAKEIVASRFLRPVIVAA